MSFSTAATTFRLIGRAATAPPRRPRPVGAVRAQLGFPSQAEDYEDGELDLNELLIRNEPSTYFYRASGWSMLQVGICDGDILVVDRLVRVQDGDIVLATWEGNAPACKIARLRSDHLELHSANPEHAPIVFAADADVQVFAVVGVVRQVKRERHRHVRAR
ncbi:MAG: hypothetical protein JSR64_09795 [Nitrospira sp.]|nr:hypothetical protein [Nitrospira sp.]MBS0194357.1 peptidase S24 [Pseudomonadota bacterium]